MKNQLGAAVILLAVLAGGSVGLARTALPHALASASSAQASTESVGTLLDVLPVSGNEGAQPMEHGSW